MEVKVTWFLAFKVWWAYFWQLMALSAVLGGGLMGLTLIEIVVLPYVGLSIEHVKGLNTGLGVGGSFFLAIFVFKKIIGKEFKEVKLVLVKTDMKKHSM